MLYPRGEYAQSKDLAAMERLPTKFLEQVLLGLRRAGLLESKVGSGGGYRLKRPPTELTVRGVLDALEPDDELDLPDPPTAGGRAVELVATELAKRQVKACESWTLADLADDAGRQVGSDVMYHI